MSSLFPLKLSGLRKSPSAPWLHLFGAISVRQGGVGSQHFLGTFNLLSEWLLQSQVSPRPQPLPLSVSDARTALG